MPALVLFDSEASHSFVSPMFSKNIDRILRKLDLHLDVEITDNKILNVASVFRSCKIEISGVKFPIDLIPIVMKEINVIVGMDWLGRNQTMIDCDRQLIRVQTPSGGEGRKGKATICSATKARRYLQHECMGFLAYVTEGQTEKRRMTFTEVPVVRDFSDVFPEDLPGIPPDRQVEFRTDLIPGAAPVAKAPYILAPPEMQELSNQL